MHADEECLLLSALLESELPRPEHVKYALCSQEPSPAFLIRLWLPLLILLALGRRESGVVVVVTDSRRPSRPASRALSALAGVVRHLAYEFHRYPRAARSQQQLPFVLLLLSWDTQCSIPLPSSFHASPPR